MNNKTNGQYSELLFSFLLKLQDLSIKIKNNHSKGVDIETNKGITFEIKSCQNLIKSGNSTRKGRFCVRHSDFEANYFVFMIPEIRFLKIIEKNDFKTYFNKKFPNFNTKYQQKINRYDLNVFESLKIKEIIN